MKVGVAEDSMRLFTFCQALQLTSLGPHFRYKFLDILDEELRFLQDANY